MTTGYAATLITGGSTAGFVSAVCKSGVALSAPGRVRTYTLAPQPLKAAEHWLSAQRAHWERRLDSLDDFLKTLKEQQR